MKISLVESEHLAVLFALGTIGILSALTLMVPHPHEQAPAPLPTEALPAAVPAATSTSTTTAARTPVARTDPEPLVRTYPFKLATTTVFWVGEAASKDNGYIHNVSSAWDVDWMEHFGGEDDPHDRCGYAPCGFTPLQNPFYVALPYQDLNRFGFHKWSAHRIPWYDESDKGSFKSIVEGRWVEIHRGGHVCFAQWMDVGPYETDDFAYVFGNAPAPKNTIGLAAGLDVSPAVRDCLDFEGTAFTAWRFVEESQVPDGPWLSYPRH